MNADDRNREAIRAAARRIAATAPPLTVAQRDLLRRVWIKPVTASEESA